MAIIQPFSFQFCTAFRERKQLADKTNEIIEVLNSADLENLPTEIEGINQDIDNLNDRVEQIEEELDNPWILCPTDTVLFDFTNHKVNYDLKIVYSLDIEYQHTNVDNVNDKIIAGSIFMNKDDPVDETDSVIFKMVNAIFEDVYNIVFADTGLTPATIEYGISHSPMPANFKGTAFNPSNGNSRIRTKTVSINFQTDDITVSLNNPFINIYYKGE